MADRMSEQDIAESHRWHAVECNNLAWRLCEQAHRALAENEEMLQAAYAAAYHWGKIGTDLNVARARMLLGHVHAFLGHGGLALSYARDSFDYIVAHDSPDWELAFGHAILAHAARAAGQGKLHSEHYRVAAQLGEGIKDPEDKAIFATSFALIPGP